MSPPKRSTEGSVEHKWTRWLVDDLHRAAVEAAPRALDAGLYIRLVNESWSQLINSDESRTEAVVQDFLERHPCLIPGALSVDGTSGHAPWPYAVITQPVLPDLSTKHPDFMWIATDSETTYPVLIEIETPHARWWHSTGSETHSDLSHAQGQLAEWRGWFAKPRNQIAFADYYDLPAFLRRRKLEPRYVLVHGRRSETGEDAARLTKRGELARKDERIMTFDRLSPLLENSGLMCVRRSARGYELHRVPPAFEVINWDDHRYAAILDWEKGLAGSEELPPSRAAYVLKEVRQLIAESKEGGFRLPRRADPR